MPEAPADQPVVAARSALERTISRSVGEKVRYRGRFAPSPTGPLHFGSLIAALASYCDARHHQGSWQLRIDDIDPPRAVPGAADGFSASLSRFGFRWDGPVVRQSERTDRYRHALRQLESMALLYRCRCTRRLLQRHPVYPGTCRPGAERKRSRRPEERRAMQALIAASGPASCSLRLEVAVPPDFDDAVFGSQAESCRQSAGDIVVKRRDGWFAYHLACAVDDGRDVTHVVRGADLIEATAAQLTIIEALRLPPPAYMHVPVALDSNGRKLGKHTLAAPVDDMPVLPTLVHAWRFLGQVPITPVSLDHFWTLAVREWRRHRVPRRRQLCGWPVKRQGST